MKCDFDVIIAGSGPGGAAAAIELAGAGVRVLVLSGEPKAPKSCGGCISARMAQSLRHLDPPDWLCRYPVDQLWLTAPGRRPGRYPTKVPGAYFVDRTRLDAWLIQKAREAGARVEWRRLKRFALSPLGVACKDGVHSLRAGWLIGAGGASCVVGRSLGLGRTGFVYRAIVEERPATPRLSRLLKRGALLELGGALGGYGWAFLRGSTLNLGMAERVTAGKEQRGLPGRYAKFLLRLGLEERPGPWRGAAIPCTGNSRAQLYRGRALVVGDAGGLADPFLGEGIGQAVFSGRLAALAILTGDARLYGAALKKSLLRDHAHARWLARLVHTWPGFFQGLTLRHPGAVELGWQVLRGELAVPDLWKAVVTRLAHLAKPQW